MHSLFEDFKMWLHIRKCLCQEYESCCLFIWCVLSFWFCHLLRNIQFWIFHGVLCFCLYFWFISAFRNRILVHKAVFSHLMFILTFDPMLIKLKKYGWKNFFYLTAIPMLGAVSFSLLCERYYYSIMTNWNRDFKSLNPCWVCANLHVQLRTVKNSCTNFPDDLQVAYTFISFSNTHFLLLQFIFPALHPDRSTLTSLCTAILSRWSFDIKQTIIQQIDQIALQSIFLYDYPCNSVLCIAHFHWKFMSMNNDTQKTPFTYSL